MTHRNSDRGTRLVDRPGVRVDHCECGTFHVHIGQLSLRLPPHAFDAVREALEEAAVSAELLRRAGEARVYS